MNERITLLAKQASTFAFTEYPKQTMATFNTNKSLDQLFNQKFAELIVAECISVMKSTVDESIDFDRKPPETSSWIESDIKEHFGVEQ